MKWETSNVHDFMIVNNERGFNQKKYIPPNI